MKTVKWINTHAGAEKALAPPLDTTQYCRNAMAGGKQRRELGNTAYGPRVFN